MTAEKPSARAMKCTRVLAYLREARERGRLGVVAASTGVPEYKLHDFAKQGGNDPSEPTILTQNQVKKLHAYFKSKK